MSVSWRLFARFDPERLRPWPLTFWPNINQSGHFPICIKFPDFSLTYYLTRSGVAYLQMAVHENFLIGIQNLQFEPPIWGTCYREGNLIVIEKCFSWHTKCKNTFSLTFLIFPDFSVPWLLSNLGASICFQHYEDAKSLPSPPSPLLHAIIPSK